MNQKELNEIKERCDKATEGPWLANGTSDYTEIYDANAWGKALAPLALVGSNPKDADFIAHARQDIPALLAEIKRLQQAQRWIPVTEGLPEEPYGCLLTVEEDDHYGEPQEVLLPYFAGYDGKRWNDGDGKEIPFEVTRWMPLPQPPKEG